MGNDRWKTMGGAAQLEDGQQEKAQDELRVRPVHRPALGGGAPGRDGHRGHPLHEPLPRARHGVAPRHQHQPRGGQRAGHHPEGRQLPHQHLHRPQLPRPGGQLHAPRGPPVLGAARPDPARRRGQGHQRAAASPAGHRGRRGGQAADARRPAARRLRRPQERAQRHGAGAQRPAERAGQAHPAALREPEQHGPAGELRQRRPGHAAEGPRLGPAPAQGRPAESAGPGSAAPRLLQRLPAPGLLRPLRQRAARGRGLLHLPHAPPLGLPGLLRHDHRRRRLDGISAAGGRLGELFPRLGSLPGRLREADGRALVRAAADPRPHRAGQLRAPRRPGGLRQRHGLRPLRQLRRGPLLRRPRGGRVPRLHRRLLGNGRRLLPQAQRDEVHHQRPGQRPLGEQLRGLLPRGLVVPQLPYLQPQRAVPQGPPQLLRRRHRVVLLDRLAVLPQVHRDEDPARQGGELAGRHQPPPRLPLSPRRPPSLGPAELSGPFSPHPAPSRPGAARRPPG